MQPTIGEIIDVLTPYANLLEVRTVNGFPFVRAHLAGSDGITKCYMYVKQIAEHQYAACDDRDDLHGRRFFPTGSISKPFVVEEELIHSWFSCGTNKDVRDYYDSVRNELSYSDFLGYMYERLIEYDIIKFDQKVRDTKISMMDFSSVKIKRTIDRIMKGHGYRVGTIWDLFDLVMIKKEALTLEGLKSKEIQVLVSKLKCVGVDCVVNGYTIEHINLR